MDGQHVRFEGVDMFRVCVMDREMRFDDDDDDDDDRFLSFCC